MFMLCYMLKRYGNGVLVLEAHIYKWKKYCRHLGGYSYGDKGPSILFGEKKLYKLRYLHQSGVKKAVTFVLLLIKLEKRQYDLDG